jgi:demethylmenaquinone methyltransferase/2-methoxy-6-polyprenyl-1,4-benzoquinol methylase
MGNEFYAPGSQRAAKVDALFTRIARRYDLINDVQSFGLHRLWKRRLVKLARCTPGAAALDVCCGTGDLAFALSAAGMRTTGLDFNEAMLQVAVQRQASVSQRSNSASVEFVRGDAQSLPFADSSFEVVTVGYGLRNLAQWEKGLSEMARVARVGGRILVLDFGKPQNAVLRGWYFFYLRLFVPLFGLVFCGSPSAYAYILESLRHYPAQQGVAAEMTRLGLRHVRVHNLLGGVMSINYGEKT